MEKTIKDVVNVTTKKKYVKPDFEVIELNMEAPLLSASGNAANSSINPLQQNDWFGN